MNITQTITAAAAAVAVCAASVAGAGAAGAATPTTHPSIQPLSAPTGGGAAMVGQLIPVDANTDHVVAAPDGRYVYAASATADTVTVVDLATHEKVAVIRVGRGPVDIAFDRSGRYAYVTNTLDGTVSVIDTATRRVSATIPITLPREGINAITVATTKAGDDLYVAAEDGAAVYRVNATTRSHTTFATQANPSTVTLAGDDLVVGRVGGTDRVDLINLTTGKVSQVTTPEQSNVSAAALLPDGHTVVMTGDGYTEWLDTTTHRFTAHLHAGEPGNLTNVTPTDDGRYTLITTADYPDSSHPANGTITVVDNTHDTVVRIVTVGQFPWSVAAGNHTVAVPDAPLTGPTHLQLIPLTDLV